MNTQETKKPGDRKSSFSRKMTFSLTIPQLVSSIFAMLAGCAWIFILGVILGRGYAPEAHIPELERIMPQAQPGQSARVIAGDTYSEAEGGTEEEKHEPTPEAPPRVIPPEDLAYREALKTKTPARRPVQPARKPEAQKTKPAAERNARAHASAQAKPEPRKQEEKQTKPSAQVFNYVYQVAAYKEAAQSDTLATKLNRSGIKARTEKEISEGVTWYKTLVSFKGTPDDTNTLKQKLKQHKINRVLLRSKTPVR